MMKKLAISLAGLWLVAACTMGNDEAMLENAVREELASRGTVKQVELTRENENRMTGYALVEPRDAPGTEVRYNCTADRGEGASSYNWRCSPAAQQASAEGGAQPEGGGDKDPQAAPANAGGGGGAGPGRAALVGRWTDDGNCGNTIYLGEDGVFITADGGRGSWQINGDQLTMSGPGGTISRQVYLNDPNTITVIAPDGSQAQSTRC